MTSFGTETPVSMAGQGATDVWSEFRNSVPESDPRKFITRT